MRNPCSLLVCVVALLASAAGAARGQTPGSGLLTCTVPPLDAKCQVQLAAKDTAVVVVVKPASTGLHPGVTELIVTSNRCCTDSTRVKLDGDGQARIRWSSATTPDDTIHLYVMIPQSQGGPLQGEVLLLPPQAAEVREIHITDHTVDNQYVWVRGGYVPATVTVDVPSLGDHVVNEADCAKIRFSVVPNVEGKASPDSGYTRWTGHDGSQGICRAETRWKLGDASAQQLNVTLSGPNLQTKNVRLRGIARLDPRVMGGLGRFRNIIRDVECNNKDERPQCAALDSFPQTLSTRTSGIEPYGAVEFPLIFLTRFRGTVPRLIFERVRLAGGTTLRHPERNPFAAVNIMPLAIPSLEGVPFQLTVGTTLGAKRNLFYGVSVDAAIITKPLVGIFGITGG